MRRDFREGTSWRTGSKSGQESMLMLQSIEGMKISQQGAPDYGRSSFGKRVSLTASPSTMTKQLHCHLRQGHHHPQSQAVKSWSLSLNLQSIRVIIEDMSPMCSLRPICRALQSRT